MNTKIIAGIAAVIVIGAGIYYFVSNKKPVDQSMVFTDNKGEMVQTSLKDLVASNKSTWCVFSTTQGDMTNSGTVYVAEGKMRGDFNTVTAGKTTESHMILKDNTSYVWTADSKQGVKMSVDALATATSSSEHAPVDYDYTTQYECKPWTVSQVSFELPAGITFTDMSAMMQGAGASASGSASTKAAQCSACNQLTGAQKTQCLAALSC